MKNQDNIIKVHVLFARNRKKRCDLLSSEQLSVFSCEYIKRISKYRRWQDIQASIIGRILLSRGLSNFYDNELNFNRIEDDEFKRPFILNSQIDFNISHASEFVICAMSKSCKIGVDIEKIRNITVQDFYCQMTESELINMDRSENLNKNFFNYWTQKEAVLKANGKGLYVPLKSFEIIKNKTCLDRQEYFLNSINIDEQYIGHLATSTKIFANEISLTEIRI